MHIKNKTLFLVLMGFVFLFLTSVLHSGFSPKITTKKIADAKPAMAELDLAGTATGEDLKKENLETAKLPTEEDQFIRPEQTTIKEGEEYFKVVKVVDGDTIDILLDGKTERLRLIGINTPEVVDPRKTVECFGREASDNAKKLLSGQEVRIEADPSQGDRDKYGRLLRYVWQRDGLFYNLEAIKDGYAYEYTYQLPYIYQPEFKAAQKYAEENKLGLWADGACGEKNINTAAAVDQTKGGCIIKGNISSAGVKIYHLPNCPYYNQTVINASQGEKWFCTEAEALAAGWRKAGNCP